MKYKIKILKDTPFDVAGTELSISEFRLKYNYICTRAIDDIELINYLHSYTSHPQLKQTIKFTINDWFKVIILTPQFESGDWVWHEKLHVAMEVTMYCTGMLPNQVTKDAANTYEDTYKRQATQQEIDQYRLVPYHNGLYLVNSFAVYVYSNIWKEITNFKIILNKYFRQNNFSNLKLELIFPYPACEKNRTISKFNVVSGGLTIDNVYLSHADLVAINKQLNLT